MLGSTVCAELQLPAADLAAAGEGDVPGRGRGPRHGALHGAAAAQLGRQRGHAGAVLPPAGAGAGQGDLHLPAVLQVRGQHRDAGRGDAPGQRAGRGRGDGHPAGGRGGGRG